MKNIIIVLSIAIASCCATKAKSQSQIIVTTDTLQWLKTNIEQRSSLFVNKPLTVLIDSLYNLRAGVEDYARNYKSDDAVSNTLPGDTVYTSKIKIYFGKVFGGGVKAQMHEANRFVNTHIPYIYIEFYDKIPFLSKIDNNVTYGTLFGPVESLVRPYVIKSIAVGEY